MAADPAQIRLRVLVANERAERLDTITRLVSRLGHDVISRNVSIDHIGSHTRAEHPDVALVGLGLDAEHALDQITKIVHEAACPVIALLDVADPAYVTEAAKRGVFAYVILSDSTDELENALDITLRRFAEFQNLEGAFGRRARIEQAKGILMERHGIDAETAFQDLRKQSQETGRRVVDIADALIKSHRLLRTPNQPEAN